VGYLLIDLKRRQLGVRELVTAMEQSIVALLAEHGIAASARAEAPGVYLDDPGQHGAKIAQLGLRVRRGCSFHGLSLNVDMDVEPFQRINPCGHRGLEVTSMALQLDASPAMPVIEHQLIEQLVAQLGYNGHQFASDDMLANYE
jgi:lipoyl(octanoyl) transferase